MSNKEEGMTGPGPNSSDLPVSTTEPQEDADMTGISGEADSSSKLQTGEGKADSAVHAAPALSAASSGSSSKQKKKPRLQWDEENLIHNALEKDRNNYDKIDEPKTPYHTLSGSEGGSSSGSAPHSPGSPAFLSRDNLVGFSEVEKNAAREKNGGTPSSGDRASPGGRSVHIAEDAGASSDGESSPRSQREFESKRKLHYQKEHPRFHTLDDVSADANVVEDEEEVVTPDVIAARERAHGVNGHVISDGVTAGDGAGTTGVSNGDDKRD